MLNLRRFAGGAILSFLLACSLIVVNAGANEGSLWLSPAALTLSKLADMPAVPNGQNNNVDCLSGDNGVCYYSEPYGVVGSDGTARLSYSDKYYPVRTYIDGRQHFSSIPSSDMAVSFTTGPVYGLYAYFNYSFSSSVSLLNNNGVKYYQMTKPPDGRLADKANHRLAIDLPSAAYSTNGEWMVVSADNLAMLRVNLRTFEVLPFAAGFRYDIGLSPQPVTAVTNDGRYAAVASKDFSQFKIYDLSTCAAVPDSITGPVSCQSRDLQPMLAAQTAGPGIPSSLRFLSDDSLSFYTRYSQDGVSKIAKFNLSASAGPMHQQDYLALGDSYISGEGAFHYLPGTDTKDNKCHVSQVSYPLLIGLQLNYNSYHSVACSGATTQDIVDTSGNYKSQAKPLTTRDNLEKADVVNEILSGFQQGYIDQLDFVKEYQPKAITVSIGGNDIGFSGRLQECLKPGTCYGTYEDRLEFVREVNDAFPILVSTYQKLLAAGPPDMRIYVIGYPQIADTNGNCGLNVHLNKDELTFAKLAIDYLDNVIESAAANAGVFYVDAQSALDGHRLCEADPGSQAMNGLTAGNDFPDFLGGPIARESYHPNDFGHLLLENRVLSATHNLTGPMPSANTNAQPPAETGLAILDAPHSGRQVKVTEYDPSLADDFVYRGTAANISINGTRHAIAPNTALSAEIHSDPISLGSFSTDSNGDFLSSVMIPADTPAGYHTIHFYGTDIGGQNIDIFKTVFVGGTADDIDGDGVPDSSQNCIFVASAGQDYDQDSIDDACDGTIGLPPADTSPPADSSVAISHKASQADYATTIPVAAEVIGSSSAADTYSPSGTPNVLAATTSPASAEVSAAAQTSSRHYLAAGIGLVGTTVLGYVFKRFVF